MENFVFFLHYYMLIFLYFNTPECEMIWWQLLQITRGGLQGESQEPLPILTVAKELTGRFKAGELIKNSAQIVGGSGGGRPDMAQAGGTELARLDEAIDAIYASVG